MVWSGFYTLSNLKLATSSGDPELILLRLGLYKDKKYIINHKVAVKYYNLD